MTSWNSFCQDTKTVKTSTLIKIYKEAQYCDSLKIAYSQKSIQLNGLIDANLLLFEDIEKERIKRKKAEEQIEEINKNLKKKKQSNALLFGVSGVAIGIITGVLINN